MAGGRSRHLWYVDKEWMVEPGHAIGLSEILEASSSLVTK
jgi:hypothetical protein